VKPQTKREAGQPVLDEQAFQQLLSAAFVMQEHNSRLKKGVVAKPEAPAKPAVAASEFSPVQQPATPNAVSVPPPKVKTEHPCTKCGRILADDEFFCGNCGNPRVRDGAGGALQKSWASLWEMHHAEDPATGELEVEAKPWSDKTISAKKNDEIELFPSELEEIVAQFGPEDEEFKERNNILEPTSAATALITAPSEDITVVEEDQQTPPVAPWGSAAKTRAWFDSLKAQQPSRDWLAEQWRVHRGIIYIGFGVLALLVVIFQWMAQPSSSSELSPFEEMLVSMGVAEAPTQQPTAQISPGNPNTKVWVDLQTALYYCPGAELYGKTPKGRYSTQLEAQRDQFNPSTRKACD